MENNAGITLTESCAMSPGAAVSGYYFSHPDSAYFGVAEIGRDQARDYAERKGWTLEEAEKWLSPNLGYEPPSIQDLTSPALHPSRVSSLSDLSLGSAPGTERRIRRSTRSKKRVRSSMGFQNPAVMQ